MHDVLVVGGGPGGLYTATLLAKDGFDTVVLEEHETVGQPVHCTGVLAAEAFDEFDVPRDAILNSLSTARFHSPAGLTVSYTTPSTEAVVIDRALFDRGIHDRAAAAGVRVHFGARVSALEITPEGVVASTADSIVRARACVIACGANYMLQRRLGFGMPPVFLRSAQLEMKAERTGDVEVYFGRDVAPKGFAWVVPVRRETGTFARVGLMSESDPSIYFRRFVGRMRGEWGLSEPEGGDLAPRQKMLPLAPVECTHADRVLLVGDAAGLVKATTGGGITTASSVRAWRRGCWGRPCAATRSTHPGSGSTRRCGESGLRPNSRPNSPSGTRRSRWMTRTSTGCSTSHGPMASCRSSVAPPGSTAIAT